MSSVFVVNVERSEGTSVVGVYLTEKLAKAAAVDYVESNTSDSVTFKKKQVKKESEESRKVLFLQDTKESPVSVTMSQVACDFPQGKGKKEKKDPLAPKKGLSPFMIFNKENREKIKTSNPEATFGDIGKLIGTAWKALNDKQKAVYTQKAEADKERYATESAAYTVAPTETAAPTEAAVETEAAPAPKKRAAKKTVKAEA
jgi:hypothetical protein